MAIPIPNLRTLPGFGGMVSAMGIGLALFALGCVAAEEGTSGGPRQAIELADLDFTRLHREADGELDSLQVSIVRFVPAGDAKVPEFVDLVSAIHIADSDYYHALNRRFRDYDVVLFELVAPAGTKIGKNARSSSLVSSLQLMMKDVLGLSFQLEEIDYTRRNLVHADLSPKEFAQSMKDRGESWWGIFAKILQESMKKQAAQGSGVKEKELFAAFFARDRQFRLKRIMAEEFSDLEKVMSLYDGEEGSTLVTERNKRALSVLRQQIDKGKRRIAIFYGAGHMKDMARRLEQDFDLQPVEESWLTAWSLVPGKP